nr:hypothetical protein [Microvirga sp. ACRRW]
MHPLAPHALPVFIPSPGGTDFLLVAMAIFLIAFVLAIGLLYMRLHHLPDHIAHKSQKIQYEIVAVLGLLAMFTHIHAFWIAGLLLALIDIPDFGTPLRRISGALDKIAADRRRRVAGDVDGKRPGALEPIFVPRSAAPPSRDRERSTETAETNEHGPVDGDIRAERL